MNTATELISAVNCSSQSTNDELKALAKAMTRQRPAGLLCISTKFYGPTNTQGARVKATINGTNVSKTVGYDHSMHTLDAHAYAAFYLLSGWFEGEQLEYLGHDETPDGKGWSFVFGWA